MVCISTPKRLSAGGEGQHKSAESPERSTAHEPPQDKPAAADDTELKRNTPRDRALQINIDFAIRRRSLSLAPRPPRPLAASTSRLVFSLNIARLLVVLVLTLCALLAPFGISQATQIEVCFAPPLSGACDPTEAIVAAVGRAQKQVFVQAYEFTSAAIAKSVVDARKRGLDVRVILDKSNLRSGYSAATFFQHEGVPLLIDSMHAIAHNKIMILDGETVITGSFNFTKSAETRNAENLVIIHDPVIAARYLENWNFHAAHSSVIGTAQGKLPESSQGSQVEKGNHTQGEIIGNRRSRVYAWPGCGSYNRMSRANRVEFSSREAAERAGYRAAKNCP